MGRVMFFLLRMAFWLTVVCVLLPSGGTKSTSPDAQIDAVQAATLAGAAVSDMRGFCARQPDACVVGGKVVVALGHKAEAGARTIYEFISAKLNEKSAPAEKTTAKHRPGFGGRSGHVDPGGHGAGLACAGSATAAPRSAGGPAFRLKRLIDRQLSRAKEPAAIILAIDTVADYIYPARV